LPVGHSQSSFMLAAGRAARRSGDRFAKSLDLRRNPCFLRDQLGGALGEIFINALAAAAS
jgi:hypothetical protein